MPLRTVMGGEIEVMFNHIHNFIKKVLCKHNVLLMREVCVFTPSAGYDVKHVDDVKINLIDCEQTIEVAERGGIIPLQCGLSRVNNHVSRGRGSPFIPLPVYWAPSRARSF